MPGALHSILKRAVLLQQFDGPAEGDVIVRAVLQRLAPESALLIRAAPEREHDWQRDFAFAEIIANILAQLAGGAAIIERIIDQLEGDAEIEP